MKYVYKRQQMSDVTAKEQAGGEEKLLKTERGPGPLGHR